MLRLYELFSSDLFDDFYRLTLPRCSVSSIYYPSRGDTIHIRPDLYYLYFVLSHLIFFMWCHFHFHLQDICRKASDEGIFGGQQPQATAAATIIFTATMCSYFSKLKEKHRNNVNNSSNISSNANNNDVKDRTYYKEKIFSDHKNMKTIDKGSLNMILTIDAASATISGVKRAYQTILLNIDAILPDVFNKSLDEYSSCRLIDREGWVSELSTFDELMKIQKQKQLALITVKEEKRKSSSNRIKNSGPSEDLCELMRREISAADKLNDGDASHAARMDAKSFFPSQSPSSPSPSPSPLLLYAMCPSTALPCSSDIARDRNKNSNKTANTNTATRAANIIPAATVTSATTTTAAAAPANSRLLQENELPLNTNINTNTNTSTKSCRAVVISPADFPIPSDGAIITTSTSTSTSSLTANPSEKQARTLKCTGTTQVLDFVKVKNEKDSFPSSHCKIGQSDVRMSNGNCNIGDYPIDKYHQEMRTNIDNKRYFGDLVAEELNNQSMCPKIEQKKLQKISI